MATKGLVYLNDENSKVRYRQGRFLGKGGFAKCYEFQNCQTQAVFAGKIVSKSLLLKDAQKEKMTQEITIHKSLNHKFIVQFHSFFEDDKNVYIVLEICPKRSLMEMHKRRKVLSEVEVRYFMRQIILACIYLHQNKVIHRDLKLGNLFISDEMEVKVGDFGLATKVGFEGERKKTLCGTPNYIAPEILSKRGHSYEVDVWSLGCIMYTLLVGSPPFETSSLKETYSKIKKNEYTIPSRVGKTARNLIKKMLRSEPATRPSMEDLFHDEFFTSERVPSRLPTSCLTMPPRKLSLHGNESLSFASMRKPLMEVNADLEPDEKIVNPAKEIVKENGVDQNGAYEAPKDCYLSALHGIIKSLLDSKPKVLRDMHEESLDPAAIPFIWISKWVDYSDKYGIGYTLCDNSVGVLFNDSTRLICFADARKFYYVDRNGTETHCNADNYPSTLSKKITLIKYFRTYMATHLLKAGEATQPREGDEMIHLPQLRAWFRSKQAMVFHLTNGTLQINFFDDHKKVILCPLMEAVSIMDDKQELLSYRLSQIEKYGCSKNMLRFLDFARVVLEKISKSDLVAGKVMNLKS